MVVKKIRDKRTALVRVTCNGFTTWCDGYRTSSPHSNTLVFLSLFGTQTAVKATWAHMVGRERNGVAIGPVWASLMAEPYSTLRSMIRHQTIHMVTIHPSATTVVSPFQGWFYMIGDRPRARFWARFNRMCPVPLRPEWRETIWEIGIAEELITPLPGFGMEGYRVTTGDAWGEAIKEAIVARKLV